MAIDGLDDLNARLAALRSGNASRRLLLHMGNAIVADARQRAPKKTRFLVNSIRVDDVNEREQTATVRAGSTTGKIGYAQFVEFGTGIYGPRRRPIVPVRAKALRFPGSNASTRLSGNLTAAQQRREAAQPGSSYVFRRSVRGRKATPYLIPAVKFVASRLGLDEAIIDVWNDPR